MRHTPKNPREATPAWLTAGAVEQLAEHPDGPGTVFPVLQVADVQLAGTTKGARRLRSERFRVLLSDGVHAQQSVLATDLNGLVKDGTLRAGSVVHLVESFCNTVENRRTFIVCKLDVLQSECLGRQRCMRWKSHLRNRSLTYHRSNLLLFRWWSRLLTISHMVEHTMI